MKKQHNSSEQEGKPRGNHALGLHFALGDKWCFITHFSLDCTHTLHFTSVLPFDKFSSIREVSQVNSLTTLICYSAISVTDSMVLES